MEHLHKLLANEDENLPFCVSINETRVLECVEKANELGQIDDRYIKLVRQWMLFNKYMNQYEEGEYVTWVATVYSKIEYLLCGGNCESDFATGE